MWFKSKLAIAYLLYAFPLPLKRCPTPCDLNKKSRTQKKDCVRGEKTNLAVPPDLKPSFLMYLYTLCNLTVADRRSLHSRSPSVRPRKSIHKAIGYRNHTACGSLSSVYAKLLLFLLGLKKLYYLNRILSREILKFIFSSTFCRASGT